MKQYIIKRLLLIIITLFGLITITFMVALAAIAAIVGGAITAMAYRDAVGRRQ